MKLNLLLIPLLCLFYSTWSEGATINDSQTLAPVTQAEAEAGVSIVYKKWSPLRVKQAIVALGGVGGGEANTMSSPGTGTSLVMSKNGVDLPIKSLVAGANTSFTVDTQNVTINNTLSAMSIAEGQGGTTTNSRVLSALNLSSIIGSQTANTVQDEGGTQSTRIRIWNFTGAGVTVSASGQTSTTATINIPGLATADEGTLLSAAPTGINFVGTMVSAIQSGGTTTVTIDPNNYLDGITSDVQNQLDAKASTSQLNNKVDAVNGSSTGETATNLTVDGLTLVNHKGWNFGSQTTDVYNQGGIEEAAGGDLVKILTGSNTSRIQTGSGTAYDDTRINWIYDCNFVSGSSTITASNTTNIVFKVPTLGPMDEVAFKHNFGWGNTSTSQFRFCVHALDGVNDTVIIGTQSSPSGSMSWRGIFEIEMAGSTSSCYVRQPNVWGPSQTGAAANSDWWNNQDLIIDFANASGSTTVRFDATAFGTSTINNRGSKEYLWKMRIQN